MFWREECHQVHPGSAESFDVGHAAPVDSGVVREQADRASLHQVQAVFYQHVDPRSHRCRHRGHLRRGAGGYQNSSERDTEGMTQQTHRNSLLVVVACLTLGALPCAAQSASTKNAQVERAFARMTPREKIAQLVVPWISGTYMADDDPTFMKILSWVDSLRVGGLIVSIGSPLDIAAKLNTLQRHARIPLLIASDLEAGTALRITGGTAFPSNMGIGATGRDQDAYAMGRITALEGRAVGIHFALAPVADINSNASNPIINTRSFGSDPHAVARLVAAEIRGLQDNGMLATAKHFPGHGDVEIDSHLALPLLNAPWRRLDTLEFVPFRSAIASNVSAVMSAHIALPAESGSPTPATLVPAVLTGMLRDSLHFKGTIVTDALNMGGIVTGYGAGEASGPGLPRGRRYPAAACRSRNRHRRDAGGLETATLHPGPPRPLGAPGAADEGEGGPLPPAERARSTGSWTSSAARPSATRRAPSHPVPSC